FQRRTVTDTLDFQGLLKPFRHARDHVGHQRAHQTVLGPDRRPIVRPRHEQLAVRAAELYARTVILFQRAFRPRHLHLAGANIHLDPAWDRAGQSSNSRHRSVPCSVVWYYQTSQSTSPPTFSLRARLSVITPREVVR